MSFPLDKSTNAKLASQLGYRGAKSQRASGRDIAIDPNFQVSSLGGLLPPGMTTKRWDNTKKKKSMPPSSLEKQVHDPSVQKLEQPPALSKDCPPKHLSIHHATLPATNGPRTPLLKENQPVQHPIPPREAALSAPVKKARSTANRPLVSMPNRSVPTRDISLPERTQPLCVSTPAAAPKPQPLRPEAEPIPNITPVAHLKTKKSSSRPLVSMPACPVPQAWSEKQSPVHNLKGAPRDVPSFAHPPLSQDASPLKRLTIGESPFASVQSPVVGQLVHSVSAHPDRLLQGSTQTESSLFKSQVEIQDITNGRKEVVLGRIVVGHPISSGSLAMVTLAVEGATVFQVTADTLLLPVHHGSTVFIRYQLPGQGEQAKQLKFSDSTTARTCFNVVDALSHGSQTETKAAPSERRLELTATASPKITSVPHVTDMAATADKTCACDGDSSPMTPEIGTDNVMSAVPSATSHCTSVAANMEMQSELDDVAAIEAVIVDHNVHTPSAQASLAVVSSLTDDDYAQIKESVRIVSDVVTEREVDVVGGFSPKRKAALKFAIMFLLRRNDFIALPLEEKKRALSIAYRKVL